MKMIRVYKISAEALKNVKKVLEAQETVDEQGNLEKNEFARNGYTLQNARSLDLEGEEYYLYIDAPEDFWERNEKKLEIEGVTRLEGEEYEKVKNAFEKGKEGVATGIGAMFG